MIVVGCVCLELCVCLRLELGVRVFGFRCLCQRHTGEVCRATRRRRQKQDIPLSQTEQKKEARKAERERESR